MNFDFLDELDHRPFPLPKNAWVMRQSWRKLLFAHWSLPAQELRALIPESLEIDTYDGLAWLGVVPFSMNEVCPRFVPPLPWISNFLELNLRTYVKKDGIAGVYFFSLDCSNPVAVRAARRFFHLPYFDASMMLSDTADGINYKSIRSSGESFSAIYAPSGSNFRSSIGSLEQFLTERYCLYVEDLAGKTYRGVIHHSPWPLQSATAEIENNTLFPSKLSFLNAQKPDLLHYSEQIDTVEWLLAIC